MKEKYSPSTIGLKLSSWCIDEHNKKIICINRNIEHLLLVTYEHLQLVTHNLFSGSIVVEKMLKTKELPSDFNRGVAINSMYSLAYNNILYTVTESHFLRIFNIDTQKCLFEKQGISNNIKGIRFGANFKKLYVFSENERSSIYDISNPENPIVTRVPILTNNLQVFETTVCVMYKYVVVIYDLDLKQRLHEVYLNTITNNYNEELRNIYKVSPDCLIALRRNNEIVRINPVTGKILQSVIPKAPIAEYSNFVFTKDDKMFFTTDKHLVYYEKYDNKVILRKASEYENIVGLSLWDYNQIIMILDNCEVLIWCNDIADDKDEKDNLDELVSSDEELNHQKSVINNTTQDSIPFRVAAVANDSKKTKLNIFL